MSKNKNTVREEFFELLDSVSGFDGVREEEPIWEWIEKYVATQREEMVEMLERLKLETDV